VLAIEVLTNEEERNSGKQGSNQRSKCPPCSNTECNLSPDFTNKSNFSPIGDVPFFLYGELNNHFFHSFTPRRGCWCGVNLVKMTLL
jgi:hypothetical protein